MKTTRLLENYLDGSLGGEECRAIEEKASSDAEFRDLIRLQKEVRECIADDELANLKATVESVSGEYFTAGIQKTDHVKTLKHYLLRIAAVLLLLAGSTFIVWQIFNGKTDYEKIFDRYYTTYDADIISRSDSEAGLITVAIASYDRKNYTEALATLDEILESEPENFTAWFFRGLVCMEMNKNREAERSFKVIPVDWDSGSREHRDWYLALALLEQEKITEASEILSRINTKGGFYAKKAQEISSLIAK